MSGGAAEGMADIGILDHPRYPVQQSVLRLWEAGSAEERALGAGGRFADRGENCPALLSQTRGCHIRILLFVKHGEAVYTDWVVFERPRSSSWNGLSCGQGSALGKRRWLRCLVEHVCRSISSILSKYNLVGCGRYVHEDTAWSTKIWLILLLFATCCTAVCILLRNAGSVAEKVPGAGGRLAERGEISPALLAFFWRWRMVRRKKWQ